jgi:hypothetical protein
MRRSKLIAAALAAALALSSATSSFAGARVLPPPPAHGNNPGIVWGVAGCAGLIWLAAFVASQREKRELTLPEAISCGLLFWLNTQPANQQ